MAVAEGAGFIGSVFTTPAIATWYVSLHKPQLAPPNWVFAPVWTMLFALMGVAAFLVWSRGLKRHEVKMALTVYLFQLLLNVVWSIIFFGLHNPGAALLEIILLWLVIVATIIAFTKISKPAAWLLVPYLLWVSLAAYLNYWLWLLN